MSKKAINLDAATKTELRALCKAQGVKGYGKLDNDGMRVALRALIETDPNYATTGAKSYGPEAAAPVVTAEPAQAVEPEKVKKASAAPKVQREEKNGVKRPSPGTACRAVWDALDAMLAAGTTPASKDVRDLATAKGWNETNSLCELSAWRRYGGIARAVLRSPAKPKAQAKAAPAAVCVDEEVAQPAA